MQLLLDFLILSISNEGTQYVHICDIYQVK